MKGRMIVAMGLAFALCSAEASAKERKLDGSGKNLTVEQTLASFTLPEGYQVNLFASEVDFPIASPMAMAFDARGRLWVANSPLYPHILPGQTFEDSIIILEDADGDGKADTHTVFADNLYIPTGFAIVQGGSAAYIAEVPYLTYAEDTDGDGVADQRQIVLHGFGTEDSHHALSAFEWGPGGAFYFNEGRFLHSQIETPYGPRRVRDGAVFRYKPSSQRLEVMSSYHYHNPWGHVFDRWGQSILADASDGANYYFAPLTNNFDYPRREKTRGENKPIQPFAKRGRPTAGCEIIRSRHFPDEAQGLYLVNQCIGFHGTRWHRMIEEGSGLAQAPQMEQDLLHSSDTTFRPVGMEFGPDGALYILDFYNPIVGHMQYSIRDPRRDHAHAGSGASRTQAGRSWSPRRSSASPFPNCWTCSRSMRTKRGTMPGANFRSANRMTWSLCSNGGSPPRNGPIPNTSIISWKLCGSTKGSMSSSPAYSSGCLEPRTTMRAPPRPGCCDSGWRRSTTRSPCSGSGRRTNVRGSGWKRF